MDQLSQAPPKLYMLLLGSKAPGRHVEQHDFFFAIGSSLKELIPDIKAFWPEAGNSLHIDGWREVTSVDGYSITVVEKTEAEVDTSPNKLFFINLGGYQRDKLEEQHYTVLTVQPDKALAMSESKKTVFFKTNTIKDYKGANSHIDDKYGIDVDDIYRIEEMLTPAQKEKYQIRITPMPNWPEDEINLGYFQLHKL